MREIKFRGYNGNYKKGDGHWIFGNLLIRSEESLPGGKFAVIEPHQELKYEEYPVRIETISQFTGLRDSRGVSIYEGDILGLKGCGSLIVGFYRSMFVTYFVGDEICDCSPLDDLSTKYEIIGNCFENPELLKSS